MSQEANKLVAFDGLRGLASLVVLIHHLRFAFYASLAEKIESHLAVLPWPIALVLQATAEGLYNGSFAVWVFWVMSAFVLSLQFFLRAKDFSSTRAHDYLENAALRRYPRLAMPVFVSVMFAYGLQASGLMYNQELAHKFGPGYEPGWLSSWYAFDPGFFDAIKSVLWASFFNYDESRTYNNVLWTMAPELFGSLALFSFLALFGHRRCRFFLYPVIALCILKLHIQWLEAFLGGILLCDLFVNGKQALSSRRVFPMPIERTLCNPIVAGILWIAVITLAGFSNYKGIAYPILACIAVGLTLVSPGTRHVFSASVPAFLGRISFGLYLVHVPIICSFSCWAYLKTSPLFGHDATAILVCFVTTLFSIVGGYCLYLWADLPSIAVSRWFAAKFMRVPKNPHVAVNFSSRQGWLRSGHLNQRRTTLSPRMR